MTEPLSSNDEVDCTGPVAILCRALIKHETKTQEGPGDTSRKSWCVVHRGSDPRVRDVFRAGIKIAGRNISNLRYADDTTFMEESEEELKSLLIKVKES